MSTDNEGYDLIHGVFSAQVISKVGTGTTQRKKIQKIYNFAQEVEKGTYHLQMINSRNVPVGPPREVKDDEFFENYSPEPEMYVQKVFPKMKELEEAVSRGEELRESGALYSAEFEFESALELDETHVRANFGLGFIFLERGETQKAKDIFERIVILDAAFDDVHKHLFNKFGISLRQNKLYTEALEYYMRADELSKEKDENLLYNIARVHYGLQDKASTKDYLNKTLAISPSHTEAKQFLAFLEKDDTKKA